MVLCIHDCLSVVSTPRHESAITECAAHSVRQRIIMHAWLEIRHQNHEGNLP